jgi:hypothetical protein
MSLTNKKIDDFLKSERRETLQVIFLGVIPVLLILIWLSFPPLGETSELTGTVVNLTGVPTEEGDRLYILVKLDNGNNNPVRVYIPRVTFYKKGKAVILTKTKPLFFGRTVYRFKKYVT